MTERGAVPDNGIAVEPREAQRPTSLAARTPQAAILGNGDIAVGARRAIRHRPVPKGRRSAAPWRLPALHPLISRGTENRDTGHPGRSKIKATGAAERWLIPTAVIPGERRKAARDPESITTKGEIMEKQWLWIPALALARSAGMTMEHFSAS